MRPVARRCAQAQHPPVIPRRHQRRDPGRMHRRVGQPDPARDRPPRAAGRRGVRGLRNGGRHRRHLRGRRHPLDVVGSDPRPERRGLRPDLHHVEPVGPGPAAHAGPCPDHQAPLDPGPHLSLRRPLGHAPHPGHVALADAELVLPPVVARGDEPDQPQERDRVPPAPGKADQAQRRQHVVFRGSRLRSRELADVDLHVGPRARSRAIDPEGSPCPSGPIRAVTLLPVISLPSPWLAPFDSRCGE